MRKLLLLGVGLLLINVLIFGQNIVRVGSEKNAKTEIKLLKEDANEMIVSMHLNSFIKNEVTTHKGISEIIGLEGGTSLIKKGAPNLPKLSESFIIPNSNKMEIEILESSYIDYQNVDIAPSKGTIYRNQNPDEVPFVYGVEYSKDQFYPGNLVQLNKPYILKDYRGQTAWFCPVQYNPVQKTLRVYTDIKVRYFKTKKAGINELTAVKSSKQNAVFNGIYQNHFKNYKQAKYDVVSEEGKMLIIAYDDYADEMADFVAWKKQRGMVVELVKKSEVGNTSSAIKTYVENYYNTNGLTFLLLVGDAQHIPSLKKSGDSDAAYGHLVGTDSYAEVIVGRFSAESAADVQTQVQRSIYYERDITTADTWLGKAMGIASDEGGKKGSGDDGESDIQHMDNIRTDLLDFGYESVDQVYDPGAQASTVTTNLNEGRALIDYVGHGSDYEFVTSGFNVNNVNALANENRLPFIFDVACVNGNFHNKTCFAEAWLRATNNAKPTGAVAMIASTINQSWAPPMDGQDEMIDLLVHSVNGNVKRTFGGITINGCMHMNDEYNNSGAEMTDTWTIFGDPSLILRNKVPTEMVVSYTEAIVVGSETFVVTADSEGANVCLSRDGNTIAKGIIQNGSVTLDVSEELTPGAAKLIIVGQDKVTHISEPMFIAPEGPYLVFSKVLIAEDANANNEADFGETFKLNVEFKNVGIEDAQNVIASLTCNNEHVLSVTESTNVNYGTIAQNEVGASSGKFIIELANNVPDQEVVEFSLVVDADNYAEQWTFNKSFVINAPVLEVGKVRYNDNFEGNNVNGYLDAGESGEIIFEIINRGHAKISNVSAGVALKAASEYLTLNTTTGTIESIEPGATTIVSFNATAAENSPLETLVPVELTVTGGAYSLSSENNIVIGFNEVFVMGEDDVVYTVSGLFYDSGKDQGTYNTDESNTITFKPSIDGKLLRFTFEEFNVEKNYDFLSIYNGSSISAPLIGKYDGNNPSELGTNGVVEANNDEGALTFVFTSDNYLNKDGWKAQIEAVEKVYYNVKFIVTDENGNLEGASVDFRGEQIITDANGVAAFETLAGNEFSYEITMDGYDTYAEVISVTDQDQEINVTLAKETFPVKFKVIDNDGFVENASVEFNGETKNTNQYGIVEFFSIIQENAAYVVSIDGYDMIDGAVNIEGEKEVKIHLIKTGVEDNESFTAKVYPNPAKDYLNITIPEELKGGSIRIYNIIGNLVLERELTELTTNIDLSGKSKGIYLYSISKDNKSLSGKLLVE